MESTAEQSPQCMEVWGGTRAVARAVKMDGLDVWIYSKPYEEAENGGDIYYASACATGRINRLLLADVCGHGRDVAATARGLRHLMRRYVNCLDQKQFVKSMNDQFTADTPDGCFATAVVTTYFAPTGRLAICNAGHPDPLQYFGEKSEWDAIGGGAHASDSPNNVPLGILAKVDYCQSELHFPPGDLLLCYTDALSEARDTSGEMIGTAGLLKFVRMLDPRQPELLIDRLLEQVAAIDPQNLLRDDVTVMLMRPTARRKPTLRQRAAGAFRLARGMILGLNPWGPPLPMPDLSIQNIGGAIFPPLDQFGVARRR